MQLVFIPCKCNVSDIKITKQCLFFPSSIETTTITIHIIPVYTPYMQSVFVYSDFILNLTVSIYPCH